MENQRPWPADKVERWQIDRLIPGGLRQPSGPKCGGPLAQHPTVIKLSFTGSTDVRAAAERIVPVSLELGAKSPSIVYPDADEDWVVDGVIAGMRFSRQSQSCTVRLAPLPACRHL